MHSDLATVSWHGSRVRSFTHARFLASPSLIWIPVNFPLSSLCTFLTCCALPASPFLSHYVSLYFFLPSSLSRSFPFPSSLYEPVPSLLSMYVISEIQKRRETPKGEQPEREKRARDREKKKQKKKQTEGKARRQEREREGTCKSERGGYISKY